MSRLAQHISAVQSRYALREFLIAAGYAAAAVAGILALGIIINRLLITIPHPRIVLLVCAAVGIGSAIFLALRRRPSDRRAAAMIDERLDLRERLSTAIAVAGRNDEFSMAVRTDAEELASQINLRGKFPLQLPRNSWLLALIALLIALLLYWLIPARSSASNSPAAQQAAQQEAAKQVLAEVEKKIEVQAKTFVHDPQIEKARSELRKELASPPKDPEQAKRDAAKALQQVAQAAQDKSQQSEAAAEMQKEMLSQIKSPPDQKGSVADAQKALAQNNPAKAQQALSQAMKQAQSQNSAQRKTTVSQLQQLSKSLSQAAQNQQTQKAIQNQLHQMGLNSKQLQQMQNMSPSQQQQALMQTSLTPQQQSQAMKLMQKLAMANKTSQQMQAMSKSAQQMAQAMQQNNAQQANQAMQSQMAQMQSQQQEAESQSQSADAAQQSMSQSMQGLGQNGGQQNGPDSMSTQTSAASSQGGMGHSPLERKEPENKPAFSIKIEAPPAGDVPQGKVLADILVKGELNKGEAQQKLQSVVSSAQQQAAEDADQETIDPGARKTVKEYFQAVEGK